MQYQRYFVEGCEIEQSSKALLRVLLTHSDAFSLIYFRYNENEKLKRSTALIKNRLKPFRIKSELVTKWPGTQLIGNPQGHIYRMETYRTDIKQFPIFEQVRILWDWDYPQFPMDPCFYHNGYAWFETSTHELYNALYLKKVDSIPSIFDFEQIGLKLIPEKEVTEIELFFNHYQKRKD